MSTVPKEYFIDFHAHLSLRAINTAEENAGNEMYWYGSVNRTIDNTVSRFIRMQTKDIAKHSQTHLMGYLQSHVKIIIDAIYPVEKDWFAFRNLPGIVLGRNAKGDVRQTVTGYNRKRLQDLSKRQDYFNELEENYQFLVDNQGIYKDKDFSYQVVGSGKELLDGIERYGDQQKIFVIPSIEGAHAFGPGAGAFLSQPLHKSSKKVIHNIQKVKSWAHPPLYVTLAHHFWNELGGHCRSMKPPINLVLNQDAGIDVGLTKLGWIVIEELLSTANGKRIPIDIKHMSAASRGEYYEFIRRYNMISADQKVPIICSHTGVSGIETLQEAKALADTGKKLKGSYFNNWSINLTDEDIEAIMESEGLIGIMIDKGLMGSPDTLLRIGAMTPEKQKDAYLKLVWDNIFHILKVCPRKSTWNHIVFSSDYDGLISHIDQYPDASTIQFFKTDLKEYLERTEYQKELWFGQKPSTIARKVFRENALAFILKHY